MKIYIDKEIIENNEIKLHNVTIKKGVKYIQNRNNKILIDNVEINLENVNEIYTYIKGYKNTFYSKYYYN